MKRACCDWAVVHQGRPADAATPARTCPKHLRGRTIHRYPGNRLGRREVHQAAQEARIRATWARWAAAALAAVR